MNNYILFGGATLLLAGALGRLYITPPPSRVLYQQDRTFVQLETDPSAGGMDAAGWNTHPAMLKPAQVAMLLARRPIRSGQGLVGALLSLAAPSEPVFTEDELALLAPVRLTDSHRLVPRNASVSRCGALDRDAAMRRYPPCAIRGPYLRFG